MPDGKKITSRTQQASMWLASTLPVSGKHAEERTLSGSDSGDNACLNRGIKIFANPRGTARNVAVGDRGIRSVI